MTTVAEEIQPPRTTIGPIGWLRKNLFSTWYNALLTLVSLWVLYVVLRGVLSWVLTGAEWRVISDNLRLLMVGQYPREEVWRVEVVVLMISFLFGLSARVWGGLVRSFAIVLAAAFLVLASLPFSLGMRLWLLGSLVVIVGTYFLGSLLVGYRRWIVGGWLLSYGVTIVLLRGFQGSSLLPAQSTGVWNGLLLTFLLAITGIVASFPLGVLLAIGRQSTLPAVRGFCILYIELIRGVPLVTILFMTQIMLPLFMPQGIRVDLVMRAMIGITLFSAAYMAENVRGGLQSVPHGQVEAARALGLNTALVMLLVVLPQALRAVIPAIVGQFISLFKDTTLVAIIGLLELLGVGKSILANPDFLGLHAEVYVFIAAVFWVFSYSMSYASRKIEEALGVGER